MAFLRKYTTESGCRYTGFKKSWNSILKEAGLEGKPGVDKLRFHDLRDTAATNLSGPGEDITFIERYPGHNDAATSAKLIHYGDEGLKEGAEALVRAP